MLSNLIPTLKTITFPNRPAVSARVEAQQRHHMRYRNAKASVIINGRAYPLHDWSLGGVRFQTPDTSYNIGGVYFEDRPAPKLETGDAVALTLQFSVFDETIDIPVMARVMRMTSGSTVARFAPLTPALRRKFDQARDLVFAEDFLSSQTVRDEQAHQDYISPM